MFGIGSTELLVILVVALIVLGPRSLASVSRSLGKAVGQFRKVSTEFQRTINLEAAQEESRYKAPKETNPPEDSPLARAIAKAKAEADPHSGNRA